jgi:hypothetical protein
MQEIHTTNIPIRLFEYNEFGDTKEHPNAVIDEIWMDKYSRPHKIQITYGGVSRRVIPRFEENRIIFTQRKSAFEAHPLVP